MEGIYMSKKVRDSIINVATLISLFITINGTKVLAATTPNEDEVNVDDHLKIVNPTDVDESSNEESSKTEVFKF